MSNKTISIIGCGNIGQSIIKGLLFNGFEPSKIIATKRNLKSIQSFGEAGVILTSDNIQAVKQSDFVIIAVKPLDVKNILEEIKPLLNPEKHIIISLATGTTTSELNEILKLNIPIFRAIPNTAAEVGESVTCLCAVNADENKKEEIQKFFEKTGISLFINEELMESATIIGACGIAFVLRYIRAMIQGGIQIGFDTETAKSIVNQTVKGAAELLVRKDVHPEQEIDKVTTPKGCTIVGLNEMEHRGFSSALIKGILASYEKIEK